MICCKIVTNFNDPNGDFTGLIKGLANYGNILWENNYLFFSDVDNYGTNEKRIAKILKKNGYANFFIDVYSKENQPNETENINGWLSDKLIKINYKEYERANQEVFSNISKGLDLLDEQIKKLKSQQLEEEDSSDGGK